MEKWEVQKITNKFFKKGKKILKKKQKKTPKIHDFENLFSVKNVMIIFLCLFCRGYGEGGAVGEQSG